MEDPFVEEVHKVRERLLQECEGDLERLMDRLKAREEEDRPRVTSEIREPDHTSYPPQIPNPVYTSGMSGKPLTLTLPNDLIEEVESLREDLLVEILQRGLREVKIARALDASARGGLSFAAAAERAGISHPELSRHAYARGLEPSFSAATLAEELG